MLLESRPGAGHLRARYGRSRPQSPKDGETGEAHPLLTSKFGVPPRQKSDGGTDAPPNLSSRRPGSAPDFRATHFVRSRPSSLFGPLQRSPPLLAPAHTQAARVVATPLVAAIPWPDTRGGARVGVEGRQATRHSQKPNGSCPTGTAPPRPFGTPVRVSDESVSRRGAHGAVERRNAIRTHKRELRRTMASRRPTSCGALSALFSG